MKKNILFSIFVVILIFAAAAVLYNINDIIYNVFGNDVDNRYTVIVDAGHEALENTIK